jgi:hypothetical protein
VFGTVLWLLMDLVFRERHWWSGLSSGSIESVLLRNRVRRTEFDDGLSRIGTAPPQKEDGRGARSFSVISSSTDHAASQCVTIVATEGMCVSYRSLPSQKPWSLGKHNGICDWESSWPWTEFGRVHGADGCARCAPDSGALRQRVCVLCYWIHSEGCPVYFGYAVLSR